MKRGLSSVLNSRAKSMASKSQLSTARGTRLSLAARRKMERSKTGWRWSGQSRLRIEFIIQRSTRSSATRNRRPRLGRLRRPHCLRARGQTFGHWIAATIQDVQGLEGRPAPVFGNSHRNAPMVDRPRSPQPWLRKPCCLGCRGLSRLGQGCWRITPSPTGLWVVMASCGLARRGDHLIVDGLTLMMQPKTATPSNPS